MKKCTVWAKLVDIDIWTDMMKLKDTIHNFVNMPRNVWGAGDTSSDKFSKTALTNETTESISKSEGPRCHIINKPAEAEISMNGYDRLIGETEQAQGSRQGSRFNKSKA